MRSSQSVNVFLGMLFGVMLLVPAMQARSQTVYSDAEIDQLLAPIALFPDVLLSQILIASTYPLEVVEAARWRREADLEGDAAVNAAAGKNWDPSVQALVAFPQVLDRMDSDLDWTQRMGEAFLNQEEQVMGRVQVLRERAYAAGSLQSQDRIRVSRDEDVIIIEPPSPQLVYVPFYDPRVIYGNWWWPNYQPYYWAPPRGYQLGIGFVWGSGISLGADIFFSNVYWPNRQVIVVPGYRPYFGHFRSPREYFPRAQPWRHDLRHRPGTFPGPGTIHRPPQPRPPAQVGRPVPPPPPRVQSRESILRGGATQQQRPQQRVAPQQQSRQPGRPSDNSAPRSAQPQGRNYQQQQRGAQQQQAPRQQQDQNQGRPSGQRDSILR